MAQKTTQNRPKWSKMFYSNGLKVYKIVWNCPKWSKMYQNIPQEFKMAQNYPKWFIPGPNVLKCPEWSNMVNMVKCGIIWGVYCLQNHSNGSVITRSPGLVFKYPGYIWSVDYCNAHKLTQIVFLYRLQC